ncbi:helix-turn-helix transcriptional regulator [Planomicrobium sp. YIM 101495]|uniref:helix-turn-helix domain-containing protein n=1 Tax=Planomicrobium sp. YIM 101495 TaxID=2665160 RepID=UPI0012B8E5A0|nr:helix-turn-helix transcriptional regulator [Planomicrobium sp. YIM 101495]MTD30511.1 tetratricopeptide repeat protein [Planomicrobium sp. YIM 101495]
METGKRIKYHRLKQRMSLDVLSSDILPQRELKKIEGGEKEPSLEVLKALCNRLSISLAPKNNPVGTVLVKNFKNSLLHPQNKGKIMEQYADIHNHPLLHANEEIELEYSIQQIRYFIITGDLDSAEEKVKELDRFKEFMNQEQFYLYHKFIGNYHYLLGDYENALKTYLMAEKIIPSNLQILERADLLYSIGISSTQCWQTDMANRYSELALKIYQQEFVPKRIVECHSNIALTEFQFGNFKTSLEHYRNAFTIGSKLDNDILLFTTEYNLAYSNYILQQFDISIVHAEHTLKNIPAEYTSDLLACYILLVKCNIEIDRLDDAQIWIEKGRLITNSSSFDADSITNLSLREAYFEFVVLEHLIDKDYAMFEQVFNNKLFPILNEKNNFNEIGYFCSHLGNVYCELGKFEEAAAAYKHSRKAYQKLLSNMTRSVNS